MQEKKISSEIKYTGRVLNLKVDTVELPDGKQTQREVVIHPGAVAVAAVNERNEIILVRQFRYPVGEILLEVPAGKLQRGEDPLACAKRELAEETGLGAGNWTHLSTFYTTPGFSDEIMYLYKAAGLFKNVMASDDDEFIEVHPVLVQRAVDMIKSGEIKDAKTIAGILMVID